MTTLDEYLKRTEAPGAEVTPLDRAVANVDFHAAVTRGTPAGFSQVVTAGIIGGELLAMLRELEWEGNREVNSLCPVCQMRPSREVVEPGDPVPGAPGFVTVSRRTKVPEGHKPDCRLDALLRKYRR